MKRIKRLLDGFLQPLGLELVRRNPEFEKSLYQEDGLRTIHNHEFLDDLTFRRAYQRGVIASAGQDLGWRWRVHVGLWVAFCASQLRGDFVECGVNRGFLSSAIMTYLDWNSVGKNFFLLDTFGGLDERFLSKVDGGGAQALEQNRQHLRTGFYVSGVESVRANFAEWRNVTIIQGSIPETLVQVGHREIAYLHLDLNCSPPEVAAAEYFWPDLVPGGFVLLDDYAYSGFRPQKLGMDGFARLNNTQILSLPTGQGLMIKARR